MYSTLILIYSTKIQNLIQRWSVNYREQVLFNMLDIRKLAIILTEIGVSIGVM